MIVTNLKQTSKGRVLKMNGRKVCERKRYQFIKGENRGKGGNGGVYEVSLIVN